jgi:hypothetical protein
MSEKPGNSSNEFETQVLTHLTELSTKMNLLISDDGETGSVPRLQHDMKAIEKKVYWFSGAAFGIGGVMHYLIDTFKAVRGH